MNRSRAHGLVYEARPARKKFRPGVAKFAGRQCRHLLRVASGGGDSPQRASENEENFAFGIPGASPWAGPGAVVDFDRRTAGEVKREEFCVGGETDLKAVGRPKGCETILGSGQRLSVRQVKLPYP